MCLKKNVLLAFFSENIKWRQKQEISLKYGSAEKRSKQKVRRKKTLTKEISVIVFFCGQLDGDIKN